VPNGRLN
jgi:queuine tRNA-ribosyltransferase